MPRRLGFECPRCGDIRTVETCFTCDGRRERLNDALRNIFSVKIRSDEDFDALVEAIIEIGWPRG